MKELLKTILVIGLWVALPVLASDNKTTYNPFNFEISSYDEHLVEVESYITHRFKNARKRFKTKALKLAPLITLKALENGVDPLFLAAQIAKESNFQPNAISSKGAIGLMQVMCCRGLCKDLDVSKPPGQILAGMRALNKGMEICSNYKEALNFYGTGNCLGEYRLTKTYLKMYAAALERFRK